MAEGGPRTSKEKKYDSGFVLVQEEDYPNQAGFEIVEEEEDCPNQGDVDRDDLDYQNDLKQGVKVDKTENEGSMFPDKENKSYQGKHDKNEAEGSMAMETPILMKPWDKTAVKLVINQTSVDQLKHNSFDLDVEPYYIQYLVHCRREEILQVADKAGCQLSIHPNCIEFVCTENQEVQVLKNTLEKDLNRIIKRDQIVCYPLHARKVHDIQTKFLTLIEENPPEFLTTRKVILLPKYDGPDDEILVVAEKGSSEFILKVLNELLNKAKREDNPSSRITFHVVEANAEMIDKLKLLGVMNTKYEDKIKCRLEGRTVICEGPSKLLQNCEEDIEKICQSVMEEKIVVQDPMQFSDKDMEQFLMKETTEIEILVRVLSGTVVLYAIKEDMMRKGREKVEQCLSTRQDNKLGAEMLHITEDTKGCLEEANQPESRQTAKTSISTDDAKTSTHPPENSLTNDVDIVKHDECASSVQCHVGQKKMMTKSVSSASSSNDSSINQQDQDRDPCMGIKNRDEPIETVQLSDPKPDEKTISNDSKNDALKDDQKRRRPSGKQEGQGVSVPLGTAAEREKPQKQNSSDDQMSSTHNDTRETNEGEVDKEDTADSGSHSMSEERADVTMSIADENAEIVGKNDKNGNKKVYANMTENFEVEKAHQYRKAISRSEGATSVIRPETKGQNVSRQRSHSDQNPMSSARLHDIQPQYICKDETVTLYKKSPEAVLKTDTQQENMSKSFGLKNSENNEGEESPLKVENLLVAPKDQEIQRSFDFIQDEDIPPQNSELDETASLEESAVGTASTLKSLRKEVSSKNTEKKHDCEQLSDVSHRKEDLSHPVEKTYDLSFFRFKLLQMEVVKEQVEERCKSLKKFGTISSWEIAKENKQFVLHVTGSSVEACNEFNQLIENMTVECDYSRKEVLNARAALDDLKKDCPLFIDGLEDDTTDTCQIGILYTDSEKVIKAMQECNVNQERKVQDTKGSKDSQESVAQHTRSKTKKKETNQTGSTDDGRSSYQYSKPMDKVFMSFERDTLQFLKIYEKDALGKLRKHFTVEIQFTSSGILLEGHPDQVVKAKSELAQISKKVQTKEVECDESAQHHLTQEDAITIVQKSKERCKEPIEVSCIGLDSTEPSYYCSWISDPYKFVLIVTYGRVENTKADAMVFPCSQDLNPVGSKSWDILRKGGKSIIMDSISQIKEKKNTSQVLKRCEVLVSEQTGNLDLQNLLFARIPVWKKEVDIDSEGLKNLCKGIVNVIHEKRLRRVVIPIDICSDFVYEDFSKFLAYFLWDNAVKELKHHSEIHFCVSTKEKAEYLRRSCNSNIGSSKENVTAVLHYVPIDMMDLMDDVPESEKAIPRIQLHKGSLFDMDSKVDVIVNSTNSQMDLTRGYVSNILLRKAGDSIQKECDSQSPIGIGYVVPTGAGRMNCKKIYHGVLLPMWIPSGDFSFHIMRCIMMKCLKQAEDSGYSSIAFPALGTGKLGYPWHNVAETMFNVVDEYCAVVKSSCIKTVYFVLQKDDENIVKAFEFKERVREVKMRKIEEPKGALDSSLTYLETRLKDHGIIIQIVPENSIQMMTEKPDVHITFQKMPDQAESEKLDYIFEEHPMDNCYYCKTKTGTGSKAFLKTLTKTLKMINMRRFVSVAIHLQDIGYFEEIGDKSKIVKRIGELKEEVMTTVKEIYEEPSMSTSSHGSQKNYGKIYSRRFFFVLRDDLFRSLEEKRTKTIIKLPWKHSKDWNVVTRSFGSSMSFIITSKSLSAMDVSCKQIKFAVDSMLSLREEEYSESWFEQKLGDTKGCLKPLKPTISRRLQWSHRNNWPSIRIQQMDGSVLQYDLENSLIYLSYGGEMREHASLVHKTGTKRKSPAPQRPPSPKIPDKGTEEEFSMPPSSTKDVEKEKLQERDTESEELLKPQENTIEIFTSVMASVNAGIQEEEEEKDIEKKLAGISDLRLRTEGDYLCLQSSSLSDIEGAEKILREERSSNDQQTPIANSETESKENKPSLFAEEVLTEHECTEMKYEALDFFNKHDPWYESMASRIKWKNDVLCLEILNEGDDEKLKDRLKQVSNMNSQDISFELKEIEKYSEVLQGLKSDFPNVFLFEHSDKVGITAMCDSYETFTKLKHRADVLLGRIKVKQRGNRFGKVKTGTEEAKSIEPNKLESSVTTRRHRQFAATSKELSTASATLNSDSNANSVNFQTAEGIIVKVYSASITRLSVDCIVNAANENLMHGGGVAYAISNAAGYEFDRESRDYVRKYGQIPVGRCCTTGAGNLSYKVVIHTVGPKWSDYYDKKLCEKDLQEAVEVTFKEAAIQGCESIAVPAISSGIFGVPKDICVKQYYKAIVSYSKSPGRLIKEIHFVDKDQRMVDCIIKNFKDFFSGNQGLYHQGQSSQEGQGYSNQESHRNEGMANFKTENQRDLTNHNDQGLSYQSNQQTPSYAKVASQHIQSYDRAHVPSNYSNVSSGKNTYTHSGTSQSNKNNSGRKRISSDSVDGDMVVFEVSSSITVRISVGDIIKVEAEAIVCPQDTKCQSKGGVAKAIHSVADNIYKPGEEARLRHLRPADAVVLDVKDEIKWQYVFHALPPRWRHNMSSDSYEQSLSFTFRAILSQAKECDIRFLAMPVIGFGDSGFQTVVAMNAKVFPEELEVFAGNQRRKEFTLDIHIVCNDKNVLLTLAQGFSKKNFRRVSIGTAAVAESSEGDDLSKTIRPPSFMEPIQNEKIEENCAICMDELTDPQKLKKCDHVFCKECIEQYFSYKPSCPNCGVIYGKITGDQPEGRIAIAKDMTRLPGYGSCNSIKVTYVFMDGQQGPDHPSPGTPYKGMTRSGWLPDNKEGRLVAKLLNVAFTRKLVFTIGRSRTTGSDGVLTWNDIHHKTRTHGGTERFGYPDPTYIDRVMDELSVKGVTEGSADDPAEYMEYSKVFYK